MRISLLFLSFLLSLCLGLSVKDKIDGTSVFIEDKVDESSEHFLIVVDHLEEEFQGSSLMAARDIRVSLKFDVSLDLSVSLNGKPVPIGYSELKVATQIFQVENGEHIPFPTLQRVSVRIFIAVEKSISPEGFSFSKVIIQERITGIEDSEVWQAQVLQKTFVVRHDGKIFNGGVVKVQILQGEDPNYQPPAAISNNGNEEDPISEENPSPPKHQCPFSQYFNQGKEWFGSLHFPMKLLVAFGAGALLALSLSLSLSLLRCLRSLCSKGKEEKSKNAEKFKANLKVYSVHYTSVDSDEKDQKKSKQGNPIEMA